jgi:predicted enzyme related to lactoylglutathione lyase
MARPRLDSMLLSSTDPDRLGHWYVTAFDPDHDTKAGDYRVLTFGDVAVLIDTRADISPRNPEAGRLILNFAVDDARAVATRLDELGATWVAPLEEREDALFGTVEDPDGNYVQVIQMDQRSEAAMMASMRPDGATMLSTARAFSGFAVDDLDAARRFYGEALGLDVGTNEMGMLTLALGGRDLIVYPKPGHVPATYTILNFPVADIDVAVDELAARGVRFERYEGFSQDDKGIARDPRGPAIAWFTDPAGNILAVIQA